MQIASVSADGLLKMWTIKTSECVTTIDAHMDRVRDTSSRFAVNC